MNYFRWFGTVKFDETKFITKLFCPTNTESAVKRENELKYVN